MKDYAELVKALRCDLTEHANEDFYEQCKYWDNVQDERCVLCARADLAHDAADAIEELSENWKYCSDLLNLSLKHGCKSMTALLKLYDMEGAER